ncbi:MAG: hypothetical protein FI703_07855 [SAR202 cluster bacterium]|nr:hypothetical protein [SAR202 cluster bacterium]
MRTSTIALHWLWRNPLGDYERALETAGTGIGVVFLALVALMLITMALTRYLKENDQQNDGPPDTPTPPEPTGDESVTAGQDDDPAVIAAMIAAIQVVRGGVARVIRRPKAPTNTPASSSWRSQGRQALMGTQGTSTNPRSRKR